MKALTIGGAMIDTIAIIESRRIERMTMLNAESSFLLLEEGRKTEALDISTHTGGGAVNTAIAMARLGLDVSALVKLGRDDRAETIMQRLLGEGVSTRWVLRDERAPTGASVLVASHDRNAAVFTFRGANTLLEVADLRPEAFAVDLVYVSSLSNQSAACFPEIVRRAKANGAWVAANPGVRQLSARSGDFLASLSQIDMLALNRKEAETLVPQLVARYGEDRRMPVIPEGQHVPALAARGLAGGGYEMGLPAFFRSLHDLGCRSVLLTDGRNGAYAGVAGDKIFYMAAVEVEVAGTAGAGDAFGATFAAWSALGHGPDAALKAAALNAAHVVTQVDTQSGLLSRMVLEQRIAEARETVAVW